MKIRTTLAAALLLALPAYAQAPKIDENAVIIQDGPIKVDEGDVLAFIERVPEEQRGTFRTSYDRVAAVADSVFVARSLAQRAIKDGMDKDPIMQRRLQQAQDAVLADAYGDKVKREIDKMDLAARAKELYAANAEAYRTPETVTLQHIMVSGMWRTREQARAKIDDLYKQAQGGADFLELAQRYSDDASKTLNGGTLPPIPPTKFNRVTQDAIKNLKVGEMTAPVEDESGFHVFKMVEHKMPEIPKFEDAREKIIADERDRIRKERGDALLQEIRSSPTARTFQPHLDALVIPVDPELLKKAQEAASKARAAEKK